MAKKSQGIAYDGAKTYFDIDNKWEKIVSRKKSNEDTGGKKSAVNKINFFQAKANNEVLARKTGKNDYARIERFEEQKDYSIEDVFGMVHLICPIHGGCVPVTSYELDHAEAYSKIKQKQKLVLNELNDLAKQGKLSKEITEKSNFKQYFVLNPNDNTYYGTLYFYQVYFNAFQNLWLICHACNRCKSDKNTMARIEKQPFFGKRFIAYARTRGYPVDKDIKEILPKTTSTSGKSVGLAELALEYFWKYHEGYVHNMVELYRNVINPLQETFVNIDELTNDSGSKRVYRYLQKVEARKEAALGLMSNLAASTQDVSPVLSSDEEGSQADDIEPLLLVGGEMLHASAYVNAINKIASAPDKAFEIFDNSLKNERKQESNKALGMTSSSMSSTSSGASSTQSYSSCSPTLMRQ